MVTLSHATLLPSWARVWKFLPKIPLLCSSSAGEKKKKEKQQQSAAFPLLRKSRAGEFLAGTFKRALMTVIKRHDLKWPPGSLGILRACAIYLSGSIVPLAAVCAAPLSSPLCSLLGRRRTMMVACLPMFLGWILVTYAQAHYNRKHPPIQKIKCLV